MEQRLIDANELYGIESLLNTDIVQNIPEASWLMSQVLHDIQASPTIDPEALPIVRQLRAELDKVTAERDAAYADFKLLETQSLCNVCMNLNAPDLFCADCKGSPHVATDMFKWRGPQKEE